jgi:hypothetical protein
VVAVDFGTTNTVACHDDRSPVVFRNRVRFPIFDPQGDADNRRIIKWNFVDFLPLFENTTPIPTVAKHRAVGAAGDPGLQRVIHGEDDRPSSPTHLLPAPFGRSADEPAAGGHPRVLRQRAAPALQSEVGR